MISTIRKALSAMMLSLAATLVGCDHKELCYDHSHMTDVSVGFDWSAAPDADPVTMVVHFFRPDGSLYKRVEFSSKEGGAARLEEGPYMMLFHNGTLETVGEDGRTYPDLSLSCRPQEILSPMGRNGDDAPRPSEGQGQPVVGAPGIVWAGTHDVIEVKRGVEGQAVTLSPSEVTAEYVIEIKDMRNLADDIDVSAAVTGMSQRYLLAERRHGGETVTIPVRMERTDDRTLTARFHVFGHCPGDETLSHIFTIYTSNKVYYHYNITELIHRAEDPSHVYIELDGLELPDKTDGLTPEISGWGEVVERDIPMN